MRNSADYFVRVRRALIVFASLVLLLVVVRQIFDFLGRLWSPIAFNFLQIVAVIFVTFGAVQLRPKFLYVYLVWTPFWLAWNVLVICFYANVGSLNRADSTIFNWGTRGHSWWFGNVPACDRTYNATAGIVVISNCVLEYFYVEIIEAAVHLFLALIVLILSILFLMKFQRKCHRSSYGTLTRRPLPHVTVELTANGNGFPAIDTNIEETNSAYLNGSFDASPPHRVSSTASTNGYLPNGNVVQNYRRNSNRRRSSGNTSVQRKARDRSRDRLCPPPLVPAGSSRGQPLTSSKRSRSLQMDGDRTDGGTSQRRRSSSTESSPLDSRPRSRSDALNPHQSSEPASRRSSQHRSSSREGTSPKFERTASTTFNKSPSTVYSYSAEPKRREVIQRPKVPPPPPMIPQNKINNSVSPDPPDLAQVVYRQKPRTPDRADPNRHSLFSFDPKSNTLIRYHENLARSQETVLSGISSIDQLLQQNKEMGTAAQDIMSYDSGVPSSYKPPSIDTTSRNSQSYSVAPASNNWTQKHQNINSRSSNSDYYSGRQPSTSSSTKQQEHSLQNYNPNYFQKPSSILDAFSDVTIYDEGEYLQPNSVLRNSLHGYDSSFPPPPNNLPPQSADTTIFESTPKELTPSSTPRSFYDIDDVDEGPAIPKINDRGLLV